MLRPPVLLPTPPDSQFSDVVVTDATGNLIARIDARTRARKELETGETATLSLPIWLSDPQKFHYQHPLVTGEKKAAPGSFERTKRRKTRDWY